jgi:hypothetical protein
MKPLKDVTFSFYQCLCGYLLHKERATEFEQSNIHANFKCICQIWNT